MFIVRFAVITLLLFCFAGIGSPGSANRSRVLFEEPPVVTGRAVISAIQTEPRNEPSIAVSRTNAQILVGTSKWFDMTDQPAGRANNRVVYYYSSDGGQSWGTGLLGLETPQKTWSRASSASVVSDLDGNFYIGVLMRDNLSFDSGVYVFKSIDGGRTFNNPIPAVFDIGNLGSPKIADKCYITVDTSPTSPFRNTVYAIWPSTEPTRKVILTNHLKPGESGFSEPRAISHNGDMRGPSITTGPNGELYAAWEGIGNPRVILFNASTDGGETFLPPAAAPGIDFKAHAFTGGLAEIGTQGFVIRPVHRMNSFPVIDVDRSSGPHRGMIYLAWAETTNGSDSDVFIKRLTPPDGRTIDVSPVVRVNDAQTGDQFFPWLSIDPKDGSVEVAFYDRRNDPAGNTVDVYFARSTNGGLSFAENIRLTSASSDARVQADIVGSASSQIGIGDYIALQGLNGKAYSLWTDTRREKQEIFFGRIDFEPSSDDGGGGGGGGGGGEPTNDSCQTPRVISSLPFQDELDTSKATSAVDDPASCAGNQLQKTVWYTITPGVDTVYGIDTLASDYDTVVSIYTGACGALAPVACNDNFDNAANSPTRSLLTFAAQAGVQYLIEVSGKGSGGNLKFRLGYPTITGIEYTTAPDGSEALKITGAGFATGSAQVIVNKKGEDDLMTTNFFIAPTHGDNTADTMFATKKKLKKLVKKKKTVEVRMESPLGSGRLSNTFSFTR
ncbi:MAG: hypothetical protein WBV94_18295 [Blastocatellia bacterium]